MPTKIHKVKTAAVLALFGLATIKIINLFLSDISFTQAYYANLSGDYQGSIDKIQSAVKLNQHEPAYFRELADSYCEQGETAECLKAAEKALTLNPNNSLTLKALIKTFLRTGLTQNALLLCDHLIALSPTDPEGYYLKALTLNLKGENDLSKDVLKKALELKSDYPAALESETKLGV